MNQFLMNVCQNYSIVLICLLLIILVYLALYVYKLKRMFDTDSKYEEYENGTIKKKGYHRNIWDLSFVPSLSKLFFEKDWKVIIATYLLVLFLILYLFTKEQWLADLVKVNFGLVIGSLVGIKIEDKK